MISHIDMGILETSLYRQELMWHMMGIGMWIHVM